MGAVYSTDPADFYYMDVNVPCQSACPAKTNIPAYIRALFEKNYPLSYEINRLANIFPGVLGRICSRPCEDRCRHGEGELGDPVNICHIKRAGSDLKSAATLPVQRLDALSGKRVAVIGAGPAGLAAANDLAVLGADVTVFEQYEEPGGMLRYGIPEFRLPRSVLDADIRNILRLGIRLETGVRAGADTPLDALLSDYHAVLFSGGCYAPISLDVPGEHMPGVVPGLEFMMDVTSGRPPVVGKQVLVLGAGFTAFDCARSALRLGADQVSICIRRTEGDLRVTSDEIFEAKREGVRIQSLMAASRIVGDDRVQGVEFRRTRLTETGADGRRRISPIEGSEFILPADSVLVALGQRPAPLPGPDGESPDGVLTADPETFRTSAPNLYVAGDYLTGPSTVIEAVACGRNAAERIARDLMGNPLRRKAVRMEDAAVTDRRRVWDFLPRHEMPTMTPVSSRFETNNAEVELGYTEELAHEESKRCYLCYLHYEIDISRCIYCRYCIDVAPRDCIKLVEEVRLNDEGAVTGFTETTSWRDVNAVVIDNSRCIRCGECLRVCPVDCISVTRVELVEQLAPDGEG